MYCNLKNISFKYNSDPVLQNINMEIKQGEIVSIIGPSGAGKTTLLKILTGLIEPTSGEIIYDPKPTYDKPRIIVFQDYLLFPHMSVYDNIAFGLKARKIGKTDIKEKVIKYLTYFNLMDKMSVLPRELSAGQKQRVAIARSMILEPAMLLLDEPFANLDYNLKAETAQFIRQTQKDFNVTTISVTHDQREAFSMSDKIGVLLNGKLVEFNNTDDIYKAPKNVEAAKFLGHVNQVNSDDYHFFNFKDIPTERTIFVRSKDILIEKNNDSNLRVIDIQYNGDYINYFIQYKDKISIVSSFRNNIKINDCVKLTIIKHLIKD